MKILTVVGARPQFIKAATVSRVISSTPNTEEFILHTGQHYDDYMSKIFFDELHIPKPHINLNIGSGGHGTQTGEMLTGIEKTLKTFKPDFVLVYGDTNSTLAGALAASKLHIPIAHIEAGLRSFNKKMPEEINRILTDHCSDFLFTPTKQAIKQLQSEGIPRHQIHFSGDVMYDAALYYQNHSANRSNILKQLNITTNKFFLATIHRAENTDSTERLTRIFSELTELAELKPVIMPLHPRTRAALDKLNIECSRINLINPVGYLDMAQLEMHAHAIITDSGGVQKEAFFYHTPCITLRSETEWLELVDCGCNLLFKPSAENTETLVGALEYFKDLETDRFEGEYYGNGSAARLIIDTLLAY